MFINALLSGKKIGPTNALPEYDLPSEFFIPFFQELFSFSGSERCLKRHRLW